MIKVVNIIRYLIAILLPLSLLVHPIAGILLCFVVLWINNYCDDIFFYLSSLYVPNKSFNDVKVVSPVNGIVTKIERGVPVINLKKKDVLDTSHLPYEYDLVGMFSDKWKAYDHVAIYLNKFNTHIVLHPDKMVDMYRHYSDGNIEMVSDDELVSDNLGRYLNNDAVIVEYPDFFMVVTMDKFISEYSLCDEKKGVLCQIVRGSQCDLYFKEGTFIYPNVGDCIEIYDPLAHVNVCRLSYNVEVEAKRTVRLIFDANGGYSGMLFSALKKSLSTFGCFWLMCLAVILPLLTYATPLHTLFSYAGFSSIYLFLFVRSYRHLMYSLMNVFGLKEWMVNSYKFISKAHKLWKK